MLPSPLNVTIDGVDHALVRINQDDYTSVYLKKDSNVEMRLNIRHAYEKQNGSIQMERHNIDLQMTEFFPDGSRPPRVVQAYSVIRCERGDLTSRVSKIFRGQATVAMIFDEAILAWES